MTELTDRVLLDGVARYGIYAPKVLALRYEQALVEAGLRRLVRQGFIDGSLGRPILTPPGWEALGVEPPENLFRQIVDQTQAAREALAS